MSPSRSRFVILEHDHPFLHWDLLMEAGEQLASWRLLQPVQHSIWIPSESLPAHRRFYLDYEGPVSNNRGTVRKTSQGEFTIVGPHELAEFQQRQRMSDEHPGDKSQLTFYSLFDTSLGTAAVCRRIDDATAEWWFA